MTKLKSSLLLLTLTLNAYSSTKVIYGEDNRVDVFESTNSQYVELSKSTAAMIPSYKVKEINSYEVELGGTTLEQRGMCASEKFSQQPTTANCSGFLVDKDKLVTAGHCIKTQSDCDGSVWVFDFKVEYSDQSKVVVDKSSVYKCKKIISQSLDSSTQNDYAFIELEKVVTDRKPLKLRKSGKAQVGDKLVVIGHPTGLPTKIADGASVRKVNDIYFTANLDTYGGNSGSAVFNATTGLIEGILVRGDTDYVYDSSQGCQVSNVIGNSVGRGEDVTLIGNIKELMALDIDYGDEPTQDDTVSDDDSSSDDSTQDTQDEDPYAHLPAWLRWWLGL